MLSRRLHGRSLRKGGGRSRNVGDKPMRVVRLRLTQHQGRRGGELVRIAA